MRSSLVRLRGLVALAIVTVGFPGTDLRHGLAHHFAREHLAADPETQPRQSGAVMEDDHNGDHPHLAVDFALRERLSPAEFALSAAPPAAAVILVGRNAAPVIAATAAPRSDHSTGPPPRLRAPPVA